MPEWNEQAIPVNVAGAANRLPGSSWRLPRGPIRFRIAKAGIEKTSDGTGLRADFTIILLSPPECSGAEREVRVRIPVASDGSEKAKNSRGLFRGWCEAVGYTAAQLDAGTVTLTGKSFVGKECGGWHEPKYETIARRDGNGTIEVDNGDTVALSPSDYEKVKDKVVEQPAVGAAVAASAAATQPAAAGSASVAIDLPGAVTQSAAQAAAVTQPGAAAAGGGGDALAAMLSGLGIG